MKRFILFFSLALALFFTACKDKSVETKVTVISPEEVYEAVSNSEKQLIDVRTTEEYGEGHLANSRNICVTEDDFKERISKLDKNEPIYLYCRSGKRSANAAKILEDMGFTEIYDMDGGILKWESDGLELEE